MKTYLIARREAGSSRGVEFATRLAAMSPADAVDEIYDMFCLCADEDLDGEVSCDLQIHPAVARRIAAEIVRKRYAHVGRIARMSTDQIASMIREFAIRVAELPVPDISNFFDGRDAYERLHSRYFSP